MDRALLVLLVGMVGFAILRNEKKMSQLDDKIENLETITTTLGEAVQKEVADLKTAIANGTDTSESLARLDAVGDKLTGMVSDLSADDLGDVVSPTDGDGETGGGDTPTEPA